MMTRSPRASLAAVRASEAVSSAGTRVHWGGAVGSPRGSAWPAGASAAVSARASETVLKTATNSTTPLRSRAICDGGMLGGAADWRCAGRHKMAVSLQAAIDFLGRLDHAVRRQARGRGGHHDGRQRLRGELRPRLGLN